MTAGVTVAAFRAVLGRFASGLVVVTATGAAGPVGMTVQALMSLSLDPPLVALGVDRRSGSWAQVRPGDALRLNLLREDQAGLARAFGRPGPRTFDPLAWQLDAGPPRLRAAHAWVDARLERQHDGGDHHLAVAAVEGLEAGTGEPLLFHRGRTGGFAPDVVIPLPAQPEEVVVR